MRNLMIIFLMMISFASIEAQITFESTKMITTKNKKNETQNVNSKIIINSDTTEITIFIGGTILNEKIGSFWDSLKLEEHVVFIYERENNEFLSIYIKNNEIDYIIFQTDNDNFLTFSI